MGRKINIPKKRYIFHIMREKMLIENIMPELPDDNTVYKLVTHGGFSSIGFVKVVADKTRINNLTISSLRVGRKHLMVLDELYRRNKLKHVRFIVGSVVKNKCEQKYGYYDTLVEICKANNWEQVIRKNHSKLLLFDTDAGKYVLETSSNLNENPSIEQFSFEKSNELYNFYNKFLSEIFGGGEI